MKRENFRPIFALALLFLAVAATFTLSRWIEKKYDAAASPFLAGYQSMRVHEIELYSDKAVPSDLSIRVGDEVLFIVMDNGYHNIAEDRTDRRHPRLESGEFDSNTYYSLKFNSPGTIYLYDRLNLDIRVTIHVD